MQQRTTTQLHATYYLGRDPAFVANKVGNDAKTGRFISGRPAKKRMTKGRATKAKKT